METVLISPAKVSILFLPAFVLYLLIPVAATAILTYILAKRLEPMVRSAPDFRFDELLKRAFNTYQLPHHRMPRYFLSGAIHISILISLIVLSLRVITMVLSGIFSGFTLPGLGGTAGTVYGALADIGETVVLAACVVAIIRRGIFKPDRYVSPNAMGKTGPVKQLPTW